MLESLNRRLKATATKDDTRRSWCFPRAIELEISQQKFDQTKNSFAQNPREDFNRIKQFVAQRDIFTIIIGRLSVDVINSSVRFYFNLIH